MRRIALAGVMLSLLTSIVGAQKQNRINAGSIYDTVPHIVDGANWKTTLLIVNMDTATRKYRLLLHGDDGAAKSFDFIGRNRASVISGEIAKGAILILQTPGTGATLNTGWAELDGLNTDRQVGLMAIFGTTGIPGRPDFEATIPAVPTIQYDGVMPFDNSNGYSTGLAILNASGFSQATNTITIYDESGSELRTDTLTLRAGNKQSFSIADRWPETAGRRGSIHFAGPIASWAILGLRFHPGGAFTTLNLLEP